MKPIVTCLPPPQTGSVPAANTPAARANTNAKRNIFITDPFSAALLERSRIYEVKTRCHILWSRFPTGYCMGARDCLETRPVENRLNYPVENRSHAIAPPLLQQSNPSFPIPAPPAAGRCLPA